MRRANQPEIRFSLRVQEIVFAGCVLKCSKFFPADASRWRKGFPALLMQCDCQQCSVDRDAAVGLHEAVLLEFVHEEIHSRTRGPNLLPRVSQKTLAQMIGTTRSRVNFFMNKFKKHGFIECNGSITNQQNIADSRIA